MSQADAKNRCEIAAWPTERGPRTTLFGRWDHIYMKGSARPIPRERAPCTTSAAPMTTGNVLFRKCRSRRPPFDVMIARVAKPITGGIDDVGY